MKAQDELIHKAIELDAAESARLDKVIEADAKQIPLAQVGTILLNLALIVGAVVMGAMDKAAVAVSLVGGLAAINAMTLYVGNNSGKEAKSDKQQKK